MLDWKIIIMPFKIILVLFNKCKMIKKLYFKHIFIEETVIDKLNNMINLLKIYKKLVILKKIMRQHKII